MHSPRAASIALALASLAAAAPAASQGAPPDVRLGAVRAVGGLPAATFARIVRRHLAAARACFAPARAANAGAAGRVVVGLAVRTDGTVMSTSVASDSLPDPTAGRCVAAAARAWAFPAFETGGVARASVPFELAAAPGAPASVPRPPTAPPATPRAPAAPRRWEVLDGADVVQEVTNVPGWLTSTALPPPDPNWRPPTHPFLSASARSAAHEDQLRRLLMASTSLDDYLRRLRAARFTVRELRPTPVP